MSSALAVVIGASADQGVAEAQVIATAQKLVQARAVRKAVRKDRKAASRFVATAATSAAPIAMGAMKTMKTGLQQKARPRQARHGTGDGDGVAVVPADGVEQADVAPGLAQQPGDAVGHHVLDEEEVVEQPPRTGRRPEGQRLGVRPDWPDGGAGDRRVEAEGPESALQIVINCFGHAHQGHATFEKLLGNREGAVTANDDGLSRAPLHAGHGTSRM